MKHQSVSGDPLVSALVSLATLPVQDLAVSTRQFEKLGTRYTTNAHDC